MCCLSHTHVRRCVVGVIRGCAQASRRHKPARVTQRRRVALAETTARAGKSHGQRPEGAPCPPEPVSGRCGSPGTVGRCCIWYQGVNLYRCAPILPRTQPASFALLVDSLPFWVSTSSLNRCLERGCVALCHCVSFPRFLKKRRVCLSGCSILANACLLGPHLWAIQCNGV